MISGSSDLFRNQEWSDGFWPELRSGELEGEVVRIKVDEVPRLVMVRFLDM